MDKEFQEIEQNKRPDRGNKNGLGLVFGSIFLLLSSAILLIVFIYTFIVPTNPLNPFPPDESKISSNLIAGPTPTPTNTPVPPTQTPKPFPVVIPTKDSGILFEVQSGMPWYLPHQSGCRYMYVAGSVLDTDGQPAAGYSVRLSGVIGDHPELTLQAISGSAREYSTGGFEIQIGELAPVDTQNGVYLQLFQEDGTAASPMISFSTSSSCIQNLIYINFLQVRE